MINMGMEATMNGDEEPAAASAPPARKKARKGKKKSKAERLARGLDSAAGGSTSLETLKALLEAPDATTSAHWDNAQAVALRVGSVEAKQFMVRTLLYDRQAQRAAVHYAKRLRLEGDGLLEVLLEARDDAIKCINVAKFLVDADEIMMSNDTRVQEFVVPWLDRHRADAPLATGESHDHQPATSAFFTAARLVLHPHKADAEKLQQMLVLQLLESESHHSGIILQYASALASSLASAAAQDEGTAAASIPLSIPENHSKQRLAVADRIERLLKLLWPDARVVIFGSSSTGLLQPQSSEVGDLDLCVLLPSCPKFLDDTASVVADIKDHLALYEEEVAADGLMAVTRARVPIVRWTDCQSKLQCDLCVNNVPALWNTQLTTQLLGSGHHVRQLSLWIKQWYKAHRSRGFASGISSYGMQLLVFYYLQRRGVIPANIDCGQVSLSEATIQSLDPTDIQACVKEAITKAGNTPESRSVQSNSLWSLIVGFFTFYGAIGFDFEHEIVSLREVSMKKEAKQWVRRNWRFSLSIEDPIEVDRDLGTLFSRVSLTRFRLALVEASVSIFHAHAAGETTTHDQRQRVLEALLERKTSPDEYSNSK